MPNRPIPRSPFTTRLSGSAKETELRLRNIFQWKKKRPPVILFVLIIAVLMSCFGLVGFTTVAPEEPSVGSSARGAATDTTEHPLSHDTLISEPSVQTGIDNVQQYDANGDGILQTAEFPLPTGDVYHLSEPYALLYELTAETVIRGYLENVSEDDTMLILPMLNVYGEYEDENGGQNYVCGLNIIFYYDLGAGLAAEEPFPYTSFGGTGYTARITLRDSSIVDFQTTYDGNPDPDRRIRELCGPLTGVADAMIQGTAEPIYCAGSDEFNRYNLYIDYFFPELNAGVNQTLFIWDGRPVEFMNELTIVLPEHWQGKVAYYRSSPDFIQFYHLESSHYGPYNGTVFSLVCDLGALPLNHPIENGQVLASTQNAAYILSWPTEVQCPLETQEEYSTLNPSDVQFIPSQTLLETSVNRFN